MHLLVTILVGTLNALLALFGLYTNLSPFTGHPSVQTGAALASSVLPFAVTTLFAFGTRGRTIWVVAAVLNALALLTVLALTLFLQMSAAAGEVGSLIVAFAPLVVIAAGNLAFLLSRVPSKT